MKKKKARVRKPQAEASAIDAEAAARRAREEKYERMMAASLASAREARSTLPPEVLRSQINIPAWRKAVASGWNGIAPGSVKALLDAYEATLEQLEDAKRHLAEYAAGLHPNQGLPVKGIFIEAAGREKPGICPGEVPEAAPE